MKIFIIILNQTPLFLNYKLSPNWSIPSTQSQVQSQQAFLLRNWQTHSKILLEVKGPRMKKEKHFLKEDYNWKINTLDFKIYEATITKTVVLVSK